MSNKTRQGTVYQKSDINEGAGGSKNEDDSVQNIDLSQIEIIVKNTLTLPSVQDAIAKLVSKIVIQKYEDQIKALSKKVSDLENTLYKKNEEIAHAQGSINDLEQYSRRNCLRVFGIEETPGENVNTVVMNLFKNNLRVDVSTDEIDRCHRIGKSSTGKHRPIIIKFTRYTTRAMVFQKKKNLKGSRIIIREDLTKNNLLLLNEAVKSCGSRNVWTKDGNIFCKNDKGDIKRVKKVSELS